MARFKAASRRRSPAATARFASARSQSHTFRFASGSVWILTIATQFATHTRLLPVHTAGPLPPAGRTCAWGGFYSPGGASREGTESRSRMRTDSTRFSRTDSTRIE